MLQKHDKFGENFSEVFIESWEVNKFKHILHTW